VERDVGAAPGIGRGREVIGVRLARDLEHGQGEALGYLGTAGEPLGLGPGLQHSLGVGIAGIGLGLHLGEGVEDQQGLLEALGGQGAHLGVLQQVDEGFHVEAAQHGAQQLRGLLARDQGHLLLAARHIRQEGGLHAGGVIHPGGHPVGEQVEEEGLLPCGRVGQQVGELGHLRFGQRQGRDAEGGAFGDMLAIGLKHGRLP